jgi:hypothetical protein
MLLDGLDVSHGPGPCDAELYRPVRMWPRRDGDLLFELDELLLHIVKRTLHSRVQLSGVGERDPAQFRRSAHQLLQRHRACAE